MTTQSNDTVTWSDVRWQLVGYDRAGGLFDPAAHGLHPVELNTANWRGFLCRYVVDGEQLYLDRLEVGLSGAEQAAAKAGQGPLVGGKVPTPAGGDFKFEYQDLRLPIAYTGKLLIAEGFIQEPSVNMGYHPAWKYQRVRELVIADGAVQQVEDLSERYAKIRANPDPRDLPPPRDAPPGRIERWIASVFGRSYGRSRRG